MLHKCISRQLFASAASKRVFSASVQATQKAPIHIGEPMAPQFYENDFEPTSIRELEFVRSPFYELAKATQVTQGDEARQLLSTVAEKLSMTNITLEALSSGQVTKDSVAFPRFADRAPDQKNSHIFQSPRGEPLRRVMPGELLRYPKNEDHWVQIKRSKSYIGDFFPPFEAPTESNLQELFNAESLDVEKLKEVIPNLNHDVLVHLALYLAFEAKENDKWVWRTLEQACEQNLHLMDLKQVCKLEWASNQLKPKQTTSRFNTLLMKIAQDQLGECDAEGLNYIMQGFRQKNNKGIYQLIRQTLIDRQQALDLKGDKLINLFYTFASCRPKQFGVYRHYAAEELDELVSHYEFDLQDAAEQADAEHLTRLAQTLYILKTDSFENVWWRVERRANQLAGDKALEGYHLVNILRSLSKAHHNRMVGQESTFNHLETAILEKLPEINPRDASHLMYAYGVRNLGSEAIHAAFLARLKTDMRKMDYPALFNASYYLMFRGCQDKQIWWELVDHASRFEEVLPLPYLKPFKAVYQYCAALYPEWLEETELESGSFLGDLQDKFYYSEKYFNVVRLDDQFEKEHEYQDMKAFLNGHCNVYPIPFVAWKNLFQVHYMFPKQQVAIMFHLKKYSMKDGKSSEMQKLAARVLRLHGFEVLDLDESEFKSWDYNKRVDEVKGWLRTARDRQIEKGIIEKEETKYV